MKVALVGDIHGSAVVLDRALERADVVIQLGDWGVRPSHAPVSTKPIYFLDGNHERWRELKPLRDLEYPGEWVPGIKMLPRGYVLCLAGKRFLCMGGADSVDKAYQQENNHWSEQEQITGMQVIRALENTGPIDYMLTHTPPQSTIVKHFDPKVLQNFFGLPLWWTSPSACAVEFLWERFGHPQLYCGHMHQSVTDERGVRVLNIGEILILDL